MTIHPARPLAFAALAILSSASIASPAGKPTPTLPEDRDPKAVAFAKALDGDWEGTLEYRDYSTDKRVTLPTTLQARLADEGRSASLKFRYDEGKGRFVEGENTLRVDSNRNTLAWESDGGKIKVEYSLTGLDAFADKGRGELILTGLVAENGLSVEVRQTITRDGDELKILREGRKPGEAFAFRNIYRLKRKPAPAAGPKPL